METTTSHINGPILADWMLAHDESDNFVRIRFYDPDGSRGIGRWHVMPLVVSTVAVLVVLRGGSMTTEMVIVLLSAYVILIGSLIVLVRVKTRHVFKSHPERPEHVIVTDTGAYYGFKMKYRPFVSHNSKVVSIEYVPGWPDMIVVNSTTSNFKERTVIIPVPRTAKATALELLAHLRSHVD